MAVLPLVASASTPPVVVSESAANVSATDAVLQAQINPYGQPLWYQFQLVANPSEYAAEIECPEPNPGPLICTGGARVRGALPVSYLWAAPSEILPGNMGKTVNLDLNGAGVTLQPGTTYHYRVLAALAVRTEDTIAWEAPAVDGPDRTFTTPPAASSPVVGSESITPVTPAGDATMQAGIDTEGLPALFQFHLVMQPLICDAIPACLGQTYPLPSGLLLGSFLEQGVSLDLNSAGVSLKVGREYEYWVSATSTAGTSEGAHRTFKVPSEEGVVMPLSSSAVTPTAGVSSSDAQTTPSGPAGSPAPGVKATAPLRPLPQILPRHAGKRRVRRHHHNSHAQHRSRRAAKAKSRGRAQI